MTRIWRTRGWQSVLVASMLAVVLTAGCGGSEGNDSSSQDDGGATPTDSGQANTAGPDDSDGTDGGGSDDGIAWAPFGPDDPEFPDPGIWPMYRLFAEGKCSALRDYVEGIESNGGESAYDRAVVAVCRAAVDGSEEQWATAEELLGTDPAPWGHDCLGPLVTGVMERAIAWHKEHPGQKPTVQFQRVEGKTECGRTGDPESGEPSTEEPSDDSPTPDETPTDETTEPTG